MHTTKKEIPNLWEHQKKAVAMATTPGVSEFALFMDLGTGKSASSIHILKTHYNTHAKVLRTLIICPVVVRENWRREFLIHSNIPETKITVLQGSGKKRLELAKSQPEGILITNFESMQMKELHQYLKAWRPDIVLVDESQRIRNHKALRTKLIIELGDQARYRYILSGTPILNSPMDIFGQFRFLDKGQTFDKNFFAFRAKYFDDKNAGMPSHKYFPDWRPKRGIEEHFNKLIYRKAIRVLKKDCLDLPPLLRKRVDVELSADQSKVYKEMHKGFVAYLHDKACVANLALTKALRLQQILSGYFTDESGEAVHFDDVPRLTALSEILELIPPGEKVIIWAAFQENYRAIAKLLGASKIEHRFLVGGMTDKARQTAIDEFQELPTVRVMVANQQAGGVGLNLTAASYMIYYSRGFSLEADLQSEARCYRGGSHVHTKITRIDLVAPDTIDEVILGALQRKEDLANSILRVREALCR